MSRILILMRPDEDRLAFLNMLSLEHDTMIPDNREKIFEYAYDAVVTDKEGLHQCNKDILKRMDNRLDKWMNNTKDMGSISESEMLDNMWPDGVQPATAPPVIIITNNEPDNLAVATKGGKFKYPAKISLYCATQGASIGYTTDTAYNAPWKLYTGPLKLNKGSTSLRVKAIRYGYKESREVTAYFEIE